MTEVVKVFDLRDAAIMCAIAMAIGYVCGWINGRRP